MGNKELEYTVIGGRGFIGQHLVNLLLEEGKIVYVPEKGDNSLFQRELGILIYCAGYGDCLNNPYKVFQSNTGFLSDVIKNAKFRRMIYLSSTRLYRKLSYGNENTKIDVSGDDPRRLFNLTKLISEELCLTSSKDIIIVRPSNVYGLNVHSSLFLPTLVKDSILRKEIQMFVSKDYSKDYVLVNDVVQAIFQLSNKGDLKNKIFNVASGINTKAHSIAEFLEKNTDCKVNWHPPSTLEDNFPKIDISLLQENIDYNPIFLMNEFPLIIDKYRNFFKSAKE